MDEGRSKMKLHKPIKILFVILGLLILAALILIIIARQKLQRQSGPVLQEAGSQLLADEIIVAQPLAGQTLASPITLSGRARGSWFFEASFPVQLLDEDGSVLGAAAVTAQSDWQTQDYVPFSGSLSFTRPKGKTGSLIFRNDNPSGSPQNQKEFRLKVNFDAGSSLRPPGTCAPNLAACQGNAKLCLRENVNPVCD